MDTEMLKKVHRKRRQMLTMSLMKNNKNNAKKLTGSHKTAYCDQMKRNDAWTQR